MLWATRHQRGLFYRDSAGMLSDMPTFRLQLGSVHSRDLWRPEVLRSIHWNLQLLDGHRYHCITNARLMGASNADGKESRFERHIFLGT